MSALDWLVLHLPSSFQREFILGGQKSGKSRMAESRARAWLALASSHRAVFIATGEPRDDEMRERIARHQADRAHSLPGVLTVEEPLALADALDRHCQPGTLVLVDCLTLWLTNHLMPLENEQNNGCAEHHKTIMSTLLIALQRTKTPLVLVGNEIGLGVIPLGRELRYFVDELGKLNQAVAQACDRVTFMAAGLPLVLKASA